MIKRRFKTHISLLLVVLFSIGLSISTLHSHHHLEWNHPPEFADNGGQCITTDDTLCPICAYLSKQDTPSINHSGEISLDVEEIIVEPDFNIIDQTVTVYRGRSPPVLA